MKIPILQSRCSSHSTPSSLPPNQFLPSKTRMARACVLLVLLAVLLLPLAVPSQFAAAQRHAEDKPYALIFGTVWGPDDHPIYGVKVKIRRASDKPKKARWELFSDHRGEFAQRVPAGEQDYILSADLKGFQPSDGKPLHLVSEVTVHIYNDERQDTGLHLAR